jgi:hypothetical protein
MNLLKSILSLLVILVASSATPAWAGTQTWLSFLESKNGSLLDTLVYPTGFTVEAGTKFQLLENFELEGLGVTFMLLQADHCSDILHIEEMMIIKPEASVGLTWDSGCQMEVFIETAYLESKSVFSP